MLPSNFDDIETINEAQVRELIDQVSDDGSLFARLHGIFFAEGPELVADFKRLLPGGDRSAIHEVVHKIKGSAAAMGAKRIHALAGRAVEVCREEGDLSELSDYPDRIDAEYRRYDAASQRFL